MLTPQGVAELTKVLGRLKEQGQAVDLHHAQAARGALARRPRSRSCARAASRGRSTTARCDRSTPTSCGPRSCGSCSARRRGASPTSPSCSEELAEVEAPSATSPSTGETVLELRDVSASGEGAELGIEDVSLELKQGEILGVAGVDGNGQRALAEVIAGPARDASRGDVLLYGGAGDAHVRLRAPEARASLRHRRPPRRGDRALAAGRPQSLAQAHRRAPVLAARPDPAARPSTSARRPSSCASSTSGRRASRTRAGTLSGGNIQKVLLARELSFDPKVVVFNKPTYGLDVRTTATVRDLIRELVARRRRGAGDLDRSRRAARDLRPHRRALAGAPRRGGPERPGCRRARRRADGRERVGGRVTTDAVSGDTAVASAAPRAQRLGPRRAGRSTSSFARSCRSCSRSSPAACSCSRSGATRSPSTATSGRAGIERRRTWQDSAIRMAPLLLIAAGLTVDLPGEHLEPRLQRPVPARRRARRRLRAVADAATCRWRFAIAAPLPDGRRGRRALDAGAGAPEGALRHERDHHDADDVVHRHRPREHPDQGAVPGSAVEHPADARASTFEKMLPAIPGTRIHVGLLVAFAAILVVHYVLTRTSWGLRLQIMGANPRAARHVGVNLPRLIIVELPRLGVPRRRWPPPPTSSASGATSAPAGTRPTATR